MDEKKKTQKKKGVLSFKGMRIKERLSKAFNTIIIIASIGSVFGIIALMVVMGNFKNAMQNYALPQGDIALFMNEYAECRSNMRGIIGYEDQDMIDTLMAKYETRVENTYHKLADIEATMVTKEGRESYDKIKAALEAYHAKELEIVKIGATTDQEQCRKAQKMAIEELTPLYEALDTATLELMNINIQKEASLLGSSSYTPFSKNDFPACSLGTSKKHTSKTISANSDTLQTVSKKAIADVGGLVIETLNYYDG